MGPEDLAQVLRSLPPIEDPAVLVGTSTADDAAAYRIDAQRAILQTVDFITPIVDDPYAYGQIAAANSISDIYAMGGRPLFALNIVCFPAKKLPLEVLGQILQGGADKAREAGIAIVGGHSVDDAEPKYGLVVTGIVPAADVLTNAGARPGDRLVLTKPLGSGIRSTALKRGLLSAAETDEMIRVMATLNRGAAEALQGLEIHALTDITGFGLLGHLFEMLSGSGVSARLDAPRVPLLMGIRELAGQGIHPGGAKRNLARVASQIDWPAELGDDWKMALADPQTSGGLLIAVAPHDLERLLERLAAAQTLAAAVIGEITAGTPSRLRVQA